MNKELSIIRDWKLHAAIFIISAISEKIGIIKIPLGPGSIMFLPLLYSMALGLIMYLSKPIKFIGEKQAPSAEKFIVVGIGIFLAKIGVQSGAAIKSVIEAGPALILQEFGNLGTIFASLPIALFLGFKRESIGMCHSIAREPNVGLIASKYSFNSSEGRGVMIIYIVGTLIGTIFMGLMSSFLASYTSLHPYALAMATGVGSGSMMAASSAPLVEMFPEMATEITAFAGMSNLLSTADGIYMSIFIGLPLTEFLYKKLEPLFGKGKQAANVDIV
ncbi:MAG: DUF3100 domain-containing protein [Sedimentibacter sp.]|uniref:DUF3100 domain-containing protein n=1 Tax=Sedimentibacter sp. TaxID=1960295 RepID=UPI00315877AF